MFLGEIFQTQTQTMNGWPDLSHKKLTQFLTRTHHYDSERFYKSPNEWMIGWVPELLEQEREMLFNWW